MKIILIPGCNKCPHGAQWSFEKNEYMCSQLLIVNKNPKIPLSGCPLDEAFDTIREILNTSENK